MIMVLQSNALIKCLVPGSLKFRLELVITQVLPLRNFYGVSLALMCMTPYKVLNKQGR
jgi:hypothetical protein